MREVKCYHCGEKLNKNDAILEIHKTEKNEYKRYLHKEPCHKKYILNMKEKQELDKLCQYIKQEILKYEKHIAIPKYLVQRLQGVRSGQFATAKGVQVFNSDNGYPYSIILMTFKVKKMDIINAISQNYKFKSEKHKIDYMISIITNSINDVYFRIKEREESDKRVEKISINTEHDKYEFRNQTKINENKVANKLKDLF